jgi:SAM-dependent methyltransferase
MDHLHRFLSMYVGRRLPLRSFVDFEAFGTSQTLVHYCVVLSSFLLVWRSQSSSALLLAGNEPLGGSETVVAIFRALAELVGTPYFVLASLGPLLQAWIYSEGTDAFPYRYFAVSNLGPLLALISYPTVVQPFLPTNRQFKAFSIAYVIVVLASLFLAPYHSKPVSNPPSEANAGMDLKPFRRTQVLWAVLAGCAVVLLVAVTYHLSQNVAAVPFLWVIPLVVYLLTLVLCFGGPGFYRRRLFLGLLPVAVAVMSYQLMPHVAASSLRQLIFLFCAGLFICCMVCHGELSLLKPAAPYLTTFYLLVAAGGALGGLFAGVLSPYLFSGPFELPIGLGLCVLFVAWILLHDSQIMLATRPQIGVLLAAVVLCGSLYYGMVSSVPGTRKTSRNFYGSLRVIDVAARDPNDAQRILMNGTIEHGAQFLSPARADIPTAFYGAGSGIGILLLGRQQQGPLSVAVVGLGAGTIAAYGREGDTYTFYEINPLVIQVANSDFTFLHDSKARISVVPGDGRISLSRENGKKFDVIAVDAFSGDAVPVHLLTREAMQLYTRHLADGGVLALHVSNKYLDLVSVVDTVASNLGLYGLIIHNEPDSARAVRRSTWVLLSPYPAAVESGPLREAGLPLRPGTVRAWTDDYSDLLGVMKH